jgi:hypothetical protein
MKRFHCTYSNDLNVQFEALVAELGGTLVPDTKVEKDGHILQAVSIPNDKAVEFHHRAVSIKVVVQKM